MVLSEHQRERVLARIDRSAGQEACWPWAGTRRRDGYGQMYIGPRDARAPIQSAHRLAWTVLVGPIPSGKHILHKCDNKPCCNPKHLYPGTPQNNTSDMLSRGRSPTARNGKHWTVQPGRGMPRGDDHWMAERPWLIPRGETQGTSKLTESQVREICELRLAGASTVTLAKQFGVGFQQICRILKGERWAHVVTPDLRAALAQVPKQLQRGEGHYCARRKRAAHHH